MSENDTTLEIRRRVAQGSKGNGHTTPKPAHATGRAITSLSDAGAHFPAGRADLSQTVAVAVRNGACYECLNCGEGLGCS